MRPGIILSHARSSPFVRGLLYPAIAVRRVLQRRHRAIRDDLLHSLCARLARDPVVHVPEFRGTFVMDCRSSTFKRLVLENAYESRIVEHCIDRINRQRDVLDIGANIGLFTVLFAKLLTEGGGTVLSIEPTRGALARLRENIALNAVQNVRVFEGAATNRPGQVTVKTVEGREEYSTLGAMEHPSITTVPHSEEVVAAATVDELVRRFSIDPGFVKVDVEGAEHLVFEGAKEVLGKSRPVIIAELSDYLLRKNGSSAAQVIALLRGSGYQVVDAMEPEIPPGRKPFGDILCLPE
jgi:FkbM family methyltransferase